MKCISYKKGYKYQIVEEYSVTIPLHPSEDIESDYISLDTDGKITIKKGYAWDGPSGPTLDTPNFMRASLIHDALYQLMREDKLDKGRDRKLADKLLQQMCREDGMNSLRAWLVYRGVRTFGNPSADPSNVKPVVVAPRSC